MAFHLFRLDDRLRRKWSVKYLAGVDEAGRGPWAGPVVAAAVILPVDFDLPGLNDSKKLSIQQREQYEPIIRRHAVSYGIGTASPDEIDHVNILEATRRAMLRAVEQLISKPDRVLVDGLHSPDPRDPVFVPIVRGDAKSACIAAASVMAKVTRDRLMHEASIHYPLYGFDRHKGYGTGLHRERLITYGPSPIHRKSYSPVRSAQLKKSHEPKLRD